MTRVLSVVRDTPKSENVAMRVRRLQAEARALAGDHVRELTSAMADLETLAMEIAGGGDAYSPGIRDVARRLAEDLADRATTIEAIRARTGA